MFHIRHIDTVEFVNYGKKLTVQNQDKDVLNVTDN